MDGVSSPVREAATSVEVVGPGDTPVDIELVRGRTISGTLLGTDGAAVDVIAESDQSRITSLDATGAFTLEGLWPDQYDLVFLSRPVGDADGGLPYGTYDGPGNVLVDGWSGVPVDVTAGDVTDVLATAPVTPILHGTVSDWRGPLAGAGVAICGEERGCVFARTGSDGRYRVPNVRPDTYRIQGSALHHLNVSWEHGRSNPDPDAASGVTITGSSRRIDLVLPTGVSIAGTVRDAGGQGLAGIDVFGRGGRRHQPRRARRDHHACGRHLHVDRPGQRPVPPQLHAARGIVVPGRLLVLDGLDRRLGIRHRDRGVRHRRSDGGSAEAMLHEGPAARLVDGPVRIMWTGYDRGSGIHHDTLRQQRAGGSWADAGSPVASRLDRSLRTRTSYAFRVRGTDFRSNVSAAVTGPTFRVAVVQQVSSAVRWRGAWSTASSSSASGGSYRLSTAAGAKATFRFTGLAFAWVAPVGPGYGRAQVSVDGGAPVVVDVHAEAASRIIVFATSWSASGSHSVTITNLATPEHPRIAVDAFVVAR